MAEIREEISWYKPPRRVRDALLALGEMGFEFSGHGAGGGGEDFSMTYDFPNGEESLWAGVTNLDNGKVEYSAAHNDESYVPLDELKPTKSRRTQFAWLKKRM